jgi:RNA polymerase-binding transcription factor DksA
LEREHEEVAMETQETVSRKGKARWPERDLKHFEKRLLEERRRAIAQMQQFDDDMGANPDAADGEVTSWRFHMADEGTDTYEREQMLLMASREGRLLVNIDRALRRLYKSPEKYGCCDECGERIGYERLDAIPYVATCVSCKKVWEGGRAA